jgi:2-amino-4-hydroxy-6-hydroxymethyldihydropteridine diphosphokinase
MQKKPLVYISLGSNLDNPVEQVRIAVNELSEINKTELLKTSSLYRNPPLEPKNQPDYVNAVACLSTTLRPHQLLIQLHRIEQLHKRKRGPHRFGPRTLDLDILLFGDEEINDDSLTIPHYALRQRAFVLYPLYEIAPDLQLPSGESIKDCLLDVCGDDLEIITEPRLAYQVQYIF